MHEAIFAEAMLPGPANVLGLMLRPFSLGHELWLLRQNNSWSVTGPKQVEHKRLRDLAEAVLFCSQTFRQIRDMDRDPLIQVKLALWNWRIRKSDLSLEVAKFARYMQAGCRAFPDERPDDAKPTRSPGAPFILRLHSFVMESLRLNEWEAWDYPFAVAQMRLAAHLEQEGALKIKNESDVAELSAFEEWVRDHGRNRVRKVTRDA